MLNTIIHIAEPDSFTLRWIDSHSKIFKKVILICFSEDKNRTNNAILSKRNVKVHFLKIKRPYGYILNWPSVQRLINHYNPDIIHTHYATGMGFLGAVVRSKSYKILSVLGSDVIIYPHKSFFHRHLLNYNIRRYNHIIYTSQFLKKHITRVTDIQESNLTHIPLGIPSNFKRKKQLDSGFTINIVKRVDFIYGIDVALKSFQLFINWYLENRNRPGFSKVPVLNIYGNGTAMEEFKEMSLNLGISNFVKFNGYVDNSEVPEILSKGTVSLNLSRSESFGVFILESQLCGSPVIATRIGGIPEVLENNTGGFLVANEDHHSVFTNLKKLYINQKLCNRLSDNGVKFVEKNFIWENSTIKPYLKLLNLIALKNENSIHNK